MYRDILAYENTKPFWAESINNNNNNNNNNKSVASVRERTIPTKRPPFVSEVSRIEGCDVVSVAIPTAVISVF
jgi:hypothetical protein